MRNQTSEQGSQPTSNVVAFRIAADSAAALRKAALAASYRVATALSHSDALAAAVTLAGTVGQVSGEMKRSVELAKTALYDAEDAECDARNAWRRFEEAAISDLKRDLHSSDETTQLAAFNALLDVTVEAGASEMRRQVAQAALDAWCPGASFRAI